LKEEQANAKRTNMARLEAESNCHIAERERDVYRLLARRWQSRLNSVLNQRDDEAFSEAGSVEDAAAAMVLSEREQVAIFGLGGLFRRAAATGSDDDDENNGDIEEILEINGGSRMEDDSENEDMVDEDDDSESTGSDQRVAAVASRDSTTGMSVSSRQAVLLRPQVRSVSIEGEDL
jgi:hypothetical protein